MRSFSVLAVQLLALWGTASGHGGHGSDDGGHGQAVEGQTYAERHMRTEHHLDAFDLESFFKLHDLDQDGILSRSELEAIYGLHHETSRERSSDDAAHKRKTDEILERVLAVLDQNGDGVITKTEFVSAGRDGLPEFSDHEGLGHHYDSEGEYFLHHEELYHNTPETQTEESYSHPEDIAHFEHHEDIEREEEDKARKAQGLPATDPNLPLDDQTAQPDHDEVEARLKAKDDAAAAAADQGQEPDQKVFASPPKLDDPSPEEEARRARAQSARDQAKRLKDQSKEAQARGAWGDNGEGFKKPKDKVDRLRDRIPYKYRVRSSFFGDF
ncbi:MAG: hypothetical protein CYPHOPRED_001928 [Cyphobasidiales sp. Tagirdzhanova-0007]|nr:MAG: hypothetical protein CYPHOPRED_001928 [Cyphobasidiales sp. Tagirdzhanova-0007]